MAGRVYLLPLPPGTGEWRGPARQVAGWRSAPASAARGWPARPRGGLGVSFGRVGVVSSCSIAMNGQLPRRGPRDGPGRGERAATLLSPGWAGWLLSLSGWVGRDARRGGEASQQCDAASLFRLRNCGRPSLHRRTRTTTRRHYRRWTLADRCAFVSSCPGIKCLTKISR